MSDVSKTTSNRMKILGFAGQSIDHQLMPEADAFARELFGPQPPDKITIPELFTAMSGRLKHYRQAEEQADIDLATDEIETSEVRVGRTTAHEDLLDDLRSYRDVMTGAYRRSVLRRYGLGAPPPTTTAELERYARNVVHQMRAHKLEETPRKGVAPVNLTDIADAIEQGVQALEQFSKDVEREVREDQSARAARDQVRDRGWEVYQAIATITEGCFRLVSRPDMADRVRLTSRRRQGLPEEIDETFDESGAAPVPTPEPRPEPA